MSTEVGSQLITTELVRLGVRPDDKSDAILAAAQLLVDAGNIEAGYAQSMLGREKVANTYLGSGIAIPHGLLKDRELINHTGIAVLQVPDGLEWNPGESVRIVVAIAAASDEHIGILANLTRILSDDAAVDELATTDDPEVVVARLTGSPGVPPSETGEVVDLDGYEHVEVTVDLASGLHARPATAFVAIAKEFDADVRVRHGERVANGRALASLLGLGVGPGAVVTLFARGPDSGAALEALVRGVEEGLGDDQPDGASVEPSDRPVLRWTPTHDARSVHGIGASPGLAIGPLWQLTRQHLVVERNGSDVETEQRRLRSAIASAGADLADLATSVTERSGAAEAAIFAAHEGFLDDPELLEATDRKIRAGRSAGWAWREVIEQRVAVLAKVDDPLLAARATDLGDVGNRVLRYLGAVDGDEASLPDHPVILLADDLNPSDTAAIDPARVIGFCTAVGGPTSHTAIIARALGIPAMVGAGPAVLAPADGAVAVLDGGSGTLWMELDQRDLETAQQAQSGLADVRAEEHRTRFQPAITIDGHRVEVAANVNRAGDAQLAVDGGAEGIGLMRTEFLFLGRDEPPTEEEQFEVLADMVRGLNGLPLVVRTLDIGGDKNAPYLDLPEEDNSFLGIRGIRLCFERPDLFAPQLRAIYRASKLGPVSVMFPMVSRLEDLDAAMVHAERARAEVGADPIDVGIMIEVPSAVMLAAEFARRVQFFSIGTNDLTQYVMAMDRLHPMLARQTDALHPAVLRMIDQTVRAARDAGIWVGVCGGVAGEPDGAILLSGLGVHELSVSIPSVAAVKARLRSVDLAEAQELAARALRCSTAPQVRELMNR